MAKRNLAVSGIVLLLMVSILSVGCGKTQTDNGSGNGGTGGAATGELVFWAPFGGGDYEFMKQIVDAYNATAPDFTVELVSREWGTYYQGLNSALIASSGPDFFIAHQSKLAELIPTEKLQDVRQIESDVDWSTYMEAQVDAVTFEGVQYAVPLDTHAMVLFYNKDILERAGVSEQDLSGVNGIEGWNAILDKISKVVSADEHVLDIANSGANTVQQFWAWYVLNAQAGGSYIEGDEAVLNGEAGVQAMDIMNGWAAEGYLKKGIDDASSYDIFKSGKAALNFTGVWATGNYETNPDLNFGVMPIPAIAGEQKTWGDSHTFAIPTYIDGNRKEAALAFVDWANENAVTWAKAGHVPVKKTVLASEEYLAMPYRSDYMEVLNQVEYYPVTDMLGAANDLAMIKINESFLGKYAAKEALDKAKEEIDNLLR
ncbi:extracellular solute-binding protein [Anaerotalea alkaliphila]|uniref:Extracellular solute-binding protein n=1 Tax=Anaerotalea alkaliphila TaxID=2662126 RepID=A0A7X5HUM7_9FIRM|nr:extracellular solute-binding protein [Anaerotalea alkaliphila]NDL66958.1 extracellular solute-binding protein [Anaerotalea alkaliphila]